MGGRCRVWYKTQRQGTEASCAFKLVEGYEEEDGEEENLREEQEKEEDED